MPKHGSINLYVHAETIRLVRMRDGPWRPPRLSHRQFLNYDWIPAAFTVTRFSLIRGLSEKWRNWCHKQFISKNVINLAWLWLLILTGRLVALFGLRRRRLGLPLTSLALGFRVILKIPWLYETSLVQFEDARSDVLTHLHAALLLINSHWAALAPFLRRLSAWEEV